MIVNKYGCVFILGGFKNVGLGGFVIGGGYSVLLLYFGFGVDNVI